MPYRQSIYQKQGKRGNIFTHNLIIQLFSDYHLIRCRRTLKLWLPLSSKTEDRISVPDLESVPRPKEWSTSIPRNQEATLARSFRLPAMERPKEKRSEFNFLSNPNSMPTALRTVPHPATRVFNFFFYPFFVKLQMSRPIGYIGYEFGDDEMFMQQMINDEKSTDLNKEKFLEQQKKMLECLETMAEDEEPVPTKSLNFEEAFQSNTLPEGYKSPYKTIPFLTEDVVTVNTMSHCPPDDIAKLIRNIQNSVYTLGLDEARQCRRGKLLDVLKSNTPTDHFQQQTPPQKSSPIPTDNH
ncbi:hypothetical protein L3Y34_001843 [Caenorhabditis briggsae]|uniref:Protein CBR-LIN-52 n=1 Tax=Caenorhabditis briggsae TaxID=6238 RepID=A0AAE9DEB3_CAEBR|nr:hypothetical protein L3Y34_001843 [Caenorhabditis briggsae]